MKYLKVKFKKLEYFSLGIHTKREKGGCGNCTYLFNDDYYISFNLVKLSLVIAWDCKAYRKADLIKYSKRYLTKTGGTDKV